MQTLMRGRTGPDGVWVNDRNAEASFNLVHSAWGSMQSNKYNVDQHVASTFVQPASARVKDILKAAAESAKTDASDGADVGGASGISGSRRGEAVLAPSAARRIIQQSRGRAGPVEASSQPLL